MKKIQIQTWQVLFGKSVLVETMVSLGDKIKFCDNTQFNIHILEITGINNHCIGIEAKDYNSNRIYFQNEMLDLEIINYKRKTMRDIKFRGKGINNIGWIIGYYGYKEEKEKHFIMMEEINNNCSSYFIDFEVKPETVGQFTGLKDKNGKEIYEGDIVKANIERGEFITVVSWGKKSGAWSLKCDRTNEKWGTIKYYKLTGGRIEIIGNIHDNPELIK